MKIGIITFQCAHNYGAVLQAFGLKEVLKSSGNSVNIINYRPPYKINSYRKFNPRNWLSKNPYKCIIRFFTEIIVKPTRIKRWYGFEHFMNKYLDLCPYDKDDDYSAFQALVLGSDQIWNPGLTGGNFDKVYFGGNAKCDIISYAASSRFDSLTEEQKEFFSNALPKLKQVSVRESSLANLLQPIINKKVFTVVDPTLLAGKDIFDKIAISPKEKKYLLLYQIGQWDKLNAFTAKIARKLDLEVIEIVSHPMMPRKGRIQTASPCEFIGYFKNASFVVTTSFHGLAFSLMYNKQFYCLKQNTNADLRLLSLLNKLGLNNRFLEPDEEPAFDNIDFLSVNDKIEKEVQYSKEYLDNALN